MEKEVDIQQSVIDSILSYAQMCHPKESILLLKGKISKHKILVNDVQIPPLATHGRSFSTFPLSSLPIDFSIIGIAHSHPSGALKPSITDLNKFYGRLMLITAYPYKSISNILILDRKGNPVEYTVV